MTKLYPKYEPGTYHTRELFRRVCETGDLRIVWAHKNAQKWGVDPEGFLEKCGTHCECCGSELDYGLGKNNTSKADINTPSTDHIIPRSVDETLTNSLDNLMIICNRCNTLKNNSTEEDIERHRAIAALLESSYGRT